MTFEAPEDTVAVSQDSFDEMVLRAGRPVLVEFGAEWCGPCRMLAPVLTAIARERAESLTVATVDSDQAPELGARYRILGVPTLILFRDGVPLMHVAGARPKGKLLAEIDAALALAG